MALPASGQITLNQVNVELGNSGTAQIGMNDAAVRDLFDDTSGQITMSQGHGKSSVSPASFVGSTTTLHSSSLNANGISGLATGDTIFFIAGNDTSLFGMGDSSDWNTMFAVGWPNAWNQQGMYEMLAYRTATGSDVGNIVGTGGSRRGSVAAGDPQPISVLGMPAFRGMGTPPSSPQYARATNSTSGNTTVQTFPSMTVADDGSTGILFTWINHRYASITTVPSGWTLAFTRNPEDGVSIAVMYKLNMSAGATGSIVSAWDRDEDSAGWGYIIPPP